MKYIFIELFQSLKIFSDVYKMFPEANSLRAEIKVNVRCFGQKWEIFSSFQFWQI